MGSIEAVDRASATGLFRVINLSTPGPMDLYPARNTQPRHRPASWERAVEDKAGDTTVTAGGGDMVSKGAASDLDGYSFRA